MSKKTQRQRAAIYANSDFGHWTRRILKEMRQSPMAAEFARSYIKGVKKIEGAAFKKLLLSFIK